jgi:hypothetical protein
MYPVGKSDIDGVNFRNLRITLSHSCDHFKHNTVDAKTDSVTKLH